MCTPKTRVTKMDRVISNLEKQTYLLEAILQAQKKTSRAIRRLTVKTANSYEKTPS